MISIVVKVSIAVFLFCLAALVPLAAIQVYSGQAYQTLETTLVSLLVVSLIVPLFFILCREVWRWLRLISIRLFAPTSAHSSSMQQPIRSPT